MKRILSLVFIAVLAFVLAGCGSKKYEIALITDAGTINDKSFNQGSWEGVKAYAKKHNKTHKYYQPEDVNTDEYLKTIELAVKGGAKVIVTPGFFFSDAIGKAQTKYPDVKFILVDAEPTVPNPENPNESIVKTEKNVIPVLYNDHESGFLAGYAAVMNGFTELGFMGGNPVPAVRNFGYGYIQGANYAAGKKGIDNINIKFHYLGDFNPKKEFEDLAGTWYTAGTEVIFAAAGGAGNSVMKAAEKQDNKWVIGVDIDQREESETVITSATKGLAASVIYALENLDDLGGETIYLDITNDGVGLPTNFDRMKNFDNKQYEEIVKELKEDDDFRESIKSIFDFEAKDEKYIVAELDEELDRVTVTYVE